MSFLLFGSPLPGLYNGATLWAHEVLVGRQEISRTVDRHLQRQYLCGVLSTLLDLRLASIGTSFYGPLMHKMVYRSAQGIGQRKRRSLANSSIATLATREDPDTPRFDARSTEMMCLVR